MNHERLGQTTIDEMLDATQRKMMLDEMQRILLQAQFKVVTYLNDKGVDREIESIADKICQAYRETKELKQRGRK